MTNHKTRIAVIVDPSLPLGLIANTVATICIGIGAVDTSFGDRTLTDISGRAVKTSADRPVPILQAAADEIRSLLLKALPAPDGAVVVPFPKFARHLHAFAEYQARFPACDLAAETIEGLGLAGPEKWVKSLTGNLKLLR
jgi:hypothetical protein